MNARRLAPFLISGAVALILLATAEAFAAQPSLEKLDLFESGTDGYALYRIPGVVVTKKGTVLAWCEARRNARGDWGPIDVMLRRSTDGGKTWAPRQCIVHIEGELPVNPVAVQLADGRVMLNARSESDAHRRIQTVSPDGASGWNRPAFSDQLLEPICMGSIIRFSRRPDNDKNRILFANPHNVERLDGKAAPGKSRDRRNLSVKLSYDEGKTWPVNKALEPGYSAYSDLAVLADGTILCFYERGREADAERKKPTSYAYLTLARFNIEWLTDGKDSVQ